MDQILQDIRYSLRTFARTPTFTFVVILSLALAIGANTAIFSLLNAVLLRSLPFAQPQTLVTVWEDNSKFGFPRNLTSPANYKDWMEQNNSFDQLAATRGLSSNLTGGGEPEEVDAVAVTANLFATLGVQPMLGRDFRPEEDQPGANHVAILSHALWTRRYGGDAKIINQNIFFDDEPYMVIGVMPRGIDYPDGAQVWVPAGFTQADWARRTSHFLQIVGRLKSGVSLEQAKDDMRALDERLMQQYPEAKNDGLVLLRIKDLLVGDSRSTLMLLVAAIGCILLITCSNTANLMLVRAARRRKEAAVRLALGASKSRLVRQWLTESVLLAGISAAIGLFLAPLSFNFLKVFVPSGLSTNTELHLDMPVLAFTLVISLVTALVFGTLPALQSTRMPPIDALKQGDNRATVGGKSRTLQKTLVIVEVSLAVLPLIGAGLLIQTYSKLRNVQLGFNPDHVLTMRTAATGAKYSTPERRLAFFQEVLNRVQALPGVESVGYINFLPLTARGVSRGLLIEGRPAPAPNEVPIALNRPVSASYLETMKIPLIRGRYFDQTDGPTSNVAIINEAMVKKYFPNEDPIGQRFTLPGLNPPVPPITIVGVVGNVRETGVAADYRPAMYLSYLQFTQPNLVPADLAVRTKGNPQAIAAAVRGVISSIDSNQPISKVRTMDDILDSEVHDRKASMWLLTLFASIAIIQAMLGIYGVLASIVAQQTREIGLRMALGASPSVIQRSVVGQGMVLVLIGVVIGVAAAVALTRFISSLLYGISATDVTTYILAAVGVVVVAMVAILIPAQKAMKVDPMTALRLE